MCRVCYGPSLLCAELSLNPQSAELTRVVLSRIHSEGLHPWRPSKDHYIPGLGTSVLYMLPLLPPADKCKDFVSGCQGSDNHNANGVMPCFVVDSTCGLLDGIGNTGCLQTCDEN